MRYDIKRGTEIIASQILLEGTVTEKIMGEEIANVTFSHPSKIEFHIGDKITIYGKDYFLSADPSTVKKNTREFQYTMIFFSIKYSLSNWNVFFYDNDGLLTIPEFSIMGTASTCLDIVITNANRADSGWTKGVVDETEVKNVSFSDTNCLEAISKIAEEFKLEYWIDSNKSIHFTERKPVSGYSFEYGKAKGLKDITRSVLEGGTIVTRLYVKGSDKNLPKNYRGGQKNLRIDVPCLEKNIDIYGVKEHTETFSDIYPKRVGTVTAVDPTDPNRFTDADLDFDLNAYNEFGTTVLMNGVAAKIIFQTGQLAGYRIELIEAGGFNSATKTFYLNPVKDEKDMQVPSELLRPAVGDTYIIEDIMMPEAYVLLAESEAKTKGQEYLDQNSKERFQYALDSDILYFRNQNINIQLGYTVHFKDVDFNLDDDIRVTGLQKNIQNPYDINFDLSEVTVVSSIVKSYYEQQEQTTTILNSIKYNAELARRNYLFGREFHEKVFDGEGYFDAENIKPLSIETKMISLGSRLQQFGLPGVNFQIQNNNALSNTSGKIAHQTIDPDAIREWNIPANTVIGITNNFNYIYIKCQKTGINANFVVTEAQIKVEQDADFYHFEVGYLSSVIDGYRKIKTTFGFAQLNPAELSIGRVSDPTGNNYIDLLQDGIAIKGKVEFTSDSPAYNQINDAIVIGGRNLLLKSDQHPKRLTSGWIIFKLAEPIVGDYVVQIWCSETTANSGGIGFGDASAYDGNYFEYPYLKNGLIEMKFKKLNSGTNTHLTIYVNAATKIDKIKLEKGTKATDWTPAPEDITDQITAVQNYATTVNNLVSDIANDNKVTPSEKQQLKQEYNIIVAEKPQLTTQATSYGITTALTAFNNAYNNLIIFVNPLLVNLNNTSDVDGVILRSRFTVYFTAKVNLLKAITDAIDNDLSGIHDEMEALQLSIDTEIADVNNQIDDLGDYIDGAFSDGVISRAEAIAIEKYLNSINAEKADVQNKYNQIYNDSYLTGTPKTNLETSWNTYSTSHANLITSINTAIADGLTTVAEKTDVDAKFLLYRNSLAILSTRFQEAIKAIETVAINNIQIGARNLIRGTDFSKNATLQYWVHPYSSVFPDGSASINYVPSGVYDLHSISVNAEPNMEYILSFFGRGEVANDYDLNTYVIESNDSIPNIKDNSKFFKANFTFKKFTNTFKTASNTTKLIVLFRNTATNNGTLWVKNIKLEKGNKATDWSPAPEDIDVAIAGANANSANALAQAINAVATAAATAAVTSFLQTTVDGNVVSTGTLQVGDVNGANAGISGVTDLPNGESVRFWSGADYANRYNAPHQQRDNGLTHYVNTDTGKDGFVIGFNKITRKVVFDIYDQDTGVKVAGIGDRGIIFTGYIAESYDRQNMRKLTTISFTQSTIEDEIKTKLGCEILTTDSGGSTYNVGIITNADNYLYHEGRNFESAGNAQYVGYYPSENKLGTPIANGIYVRQYLIPASDNGNINTIITYYVTAYQMVGGKITNTIEFATSVMIKNMAYVTFGDGDFY